MATLAQLTSLQTLISQANGAGQFELARVYLHRQYMISFFGWLLFLVPLLYVRPILLAIGQDPTIVDVAATYIYYCAPGTLFNALAMQNVYFCTNLETMSAQFVLGLTAVITHVIMLTVLCGFLKMGFTGLCISTTCQFIARFLSTYTLIRRTENKKIACSNEVPILQADTFRDSALRCWGDGSRITSDCCLRGPFARMQEGSSKPAVVPYD